MEMSTDALLTVIFFVDLKLPEPYKLLIDIHLLVLHLLGGASDVNPFSSIGCLIRSA